MPEGDTIFREARTMARALVGKLFLCRVSPFVTVGKVPDGIVTYRGLRRTTGRGDPSQRLWVYGRVGQPCRRCGQTIALARQDPTRA